jgi:hypothetical protein
VCLNCILGHNYNNAPGKSSGGGLAVRNTNVRNREGLGLLVIVAIALGLVASFAAGGTGGALVAPQSTAGSSDRDVKLSAESPQSGEDQSSFEARNSGNHLQFSFATSGVRVSPMQDQGDRAPAWRMDLSLSGVHDHGKEMEPGIPALSAASNRVEYEYGSLRQFFLNGESSLDQGFVVAGPVRDAAEEGASDLVLDLSVSGDLTVRQERSSYYVDLASPDGSAALRYGAVTATDANGALLPASLEIRAAQSPGEAAGIRISVEAGDASYPIVVMSSIRSTAQGGAGDAAPPQELGERVGVPVTVGMGITESVSDIMARENSLKPEQPAHPRTKYPEFDEELVLQDNPDAPAVSHWPPIDESTKAQPSQSTPSADPTFLRRSASASQPPASSRPLSSRPTAWGT